MWSSILDSFGLAYLLSLADKVDAQAKVLMIHLYCHMDACFSTEVLQILHLFKQPLHLVLAKWMGAYKITSLSLKSWNPVFHDLPTTCPKIKSQNSKEQTKNPTSKKKCQGALRNSSFDRLRHPAQTFTLLGHGSAQLWSSQLFTY